MTLIVQDGSTPDANGYISVTFFRSYHEDRCNDISTFDTAGIEGAIIRATDYLDTRFRFVGEKTRSDQRTSWPRIDAEDNNDKVRFGVPFEVEEATAEYALIALSQVLNPNPTRDDTGQKVQATSEKVGPIEESITYTSGSSFQLPKYPVADQKLTAIGLAVQGKILRRA